MKNGKFFFLFSVALLLFSIPIVNAATEKDFVKIIVDGKVAYTHKDIVNNRYLLASNKIFYGSNEGTVLVDVFLKDKVGGGFYRIGLRTKSKGVTIKSVRIDNGPRVPVLSSKSTSYTYPALIYLDGNVTRARIEIGFDPGEIGVREEFDIILYDSLGNILLVYDPFLSGFPFRQQFIMNTNGIGLSGDVASDHAILIHIPKTNTDFWANHGFTDANGMEFTLSDETTIINWEAEGFDATTDDANIWINYTDVFESSAFDSNGWMYYGGTDTDNSDGTATYPSDLNAVYHSNDASGGTTDSTSNAVNMVAQNTPTFDVDGQIDSAIDYQAGDNDYQKTSNKFTGTSGSFSAWFKLDVLSTNQTIIGGGDEAGGDFFAFRIGDTNKIEVITTVSAVSDEVEGGTLLAIDTWYHAVLTSNGSTWALYLNGVAESLTVIQGANTGEWFDDVSTIDNSTIGVIQRSSLIMPLDGTLDEIKVFTSTLTSDDVKILYNSENDSLVTFGSEEIDFAADFSFTVTPPGLDADGGINSVIIDLNDTSAIGTKTVGDWNYFIDGVRFYTSTVDGNTTRTQTTSGDFNISFLIKSTDGNVSQKDRTVTVGQQVQGVDINFSRNVFSIGTADINFGVTFVSGTGSSFIWGFPGDQNLSGQTVSKTFTNNVRQEVCVTVTGVGDVNKTTCEFFNIGRVLIKIPQDIKDSANLLTPFDISVNQLPSQSYTGLSVDSNIMFFTDSNTFNSTVSIDFNADFFGTSRLFLFTSTDLFFEFQPFLTAVEGNLEATIFTINNLKGRVTVSGIRIESFTDVNGTNTLVESKLSDGSGQAVFHFVKGQDYTLLFYDTDNTLIMTKTIEANNVEYFAYLELGILVLTPVPITIVGVEWHPALGNVIPVDQNVSFWQLLVPTNGTIGDVNVFITHLTDTNIVYNQIFAVNSSVDFNLSFDFNVAGFNDSFPLTVNLQIFDDNSVQAGATRSKSYSFKDTGFQVATERAKDALGQFGVTLLSLIITVTAIAFITKRAIGEDMNFVVIPTMFFTGVFLLIGWITFDIWASAVLFGVGMALWGVKK